MTPFLNRVSEDTVTDDTVTDNTVTDDTVTDDSHADTVLSVTNGLSYFVVKDLKPCFSLVLSIFT